MSHDVQRNALVGVAILSAAVVMSTSYQPSDAAATDASGATVATTPKPSATASGATIATTLKSSPTFVGCDESGDRVPTMKFNAGDPSILTFPYAPPSGAKPSPSPTANSDAEILPKGYSIVGPEGKVVLAATQADLPTTAFKIIQVGFKVLDPKGNIAEQPAKSTGAMELRVVPAQSQPSKSPDSLNAGSSKISAYVQDVSDYRVISIGTPLPAASASPGAEQKPLSVQSFAISARNPGSARVTIGNGEHTCVYNLAVSPGDNKSALILSSGVGMSNLPLQSVTPVQPSPAMAVPGLYVYDSELSHVQTFVPILASFRVTDNSSPWQGYVTAGLAATANTGKSLFGLSAGYQDQVLVTVGWHSAEVDVLQPGIGVGKFNPIPAGAPVTFSERTTRPFVSITFPLCGVTALFGSVLGGASSCATPAPKPTASAAPAAP